MHLTSELILFLSFFSHYHVIHTTLVLVQIFSLTVRIFFWLSFTDVSVVSPSLLLRSCYHAIVCEISDDEPCQSFLFRSEIKKASRSLSRVPPHANKNLAVLVFNEMLCQISEARLRALPPAWEQLVLFAVWLCERHMLLLHGDVRVWLKEHQGSNEQHAWFKRLFKLGGV